jgi:alpha-acetolactate decarboxylase
MTACIGRYGDEEHELDFRRGTIDVLCGGRYMGTPHIQQLVRSDSLGCATGGSLKG